MSEYADFVSDFPRRCIELLNSGEASSSAKGREVTLLLMVASTSLVIPFERLRLDTDHSSHPFGENKIYSQSSEALSSLLERPFVGSAIGPSSDNTWKIADPVYDVSGDPSDWLRDCSIKPVGSKKQVRSILKLLRNALAHGNIKTRGNPIRELIFVQERFASCNPGEPRRRTHFEVLLVTPEDLKAMIRGWVVFLAESHALEHSFAA